MRSFQLFLSCISVLLVLELGAVTNGIPVSSKEFPEVVEFANRGTGSIISNDLVLTAAHMVYDKRFNRIDLSAGVIVLPNGKTIKPINVFIPKAYMEFYEQSPLNQAKADVALVLYRPKDLKRLRQSGSINPFSVARKRPELEGELSMFGYGARDTSFRAEKRHEFGTKCCGFNVVADADDYRVVVNGFASGPGNGQSSVGAPGDSGGPLLDKNGNIFAIVSHGLNPSSHEAPNLVGGLDDDSGELSWYFLDQDSDNDPRTKDKQSTVYTVVTSDNPVARALYSAAFTGKDLDSQFISLAGDKYLASGNMKSLFSSRINSRLSASRLRKSHKPKSTRRGGFFDQATHFEIESFQGSSPSTCETLF